MYIFRAIVKTKNAFRCYSNKKKQFPLLCKTSLLLHSPSLCMLNDIKKKLSCSLLVALFCDLKNTAFCAARTVVAVAFPTEFRVTGP